MLGRKYLNQKMQGIVNLLGLLSQVNKILNLMVVFSDYKKVKVMYFYSKEKEKELEVSNS